MSSARLYVVYRWLLSLNELVVFSSYELKERAPYLGETRLTIGEPVWKSLDCGAVEALVRQVV